MTLMPFQCSLLSLCRYWGRAGGTIHAGFVRLVFWCILTHCEGEAKNAQKKIECEGCEKTGSVK